MAHIQLAQPDLRVVVGSHEEQIVEHRYSLIMAIHSKYMDAMLASQMREAATKEICFPDISPHTWTMMMSVLEDPLRARDYSVENAIICMPFYDKYDFTKGYELSQHVIEVFLKGCDSSSDLRKILHVIRLVQDLDVESLKPTAISILKKNLELLAAEDFKVLAPLISRSKTLRMCFNDTIKEEDVLSPIFPVLAVNIMEHQQALKIVATAIPVIRLYGIRNTALSFHLEDLDDTTLWSLADADYRFGGEIVHSFIQKEEESDWEITVSPYSRDEEITLWQCPNSVRAILPPKTGWVAGCRPTSTGESGN